MKFSNSSLKYFVFYSLLLNVGIQADQVKTIEVSGCGDVRIYRKPFGWKEKAVVMGLFPLSILCGHIGYTTESRKKDLPIYCYGASAILMGAGLYGTHCLIDWHNKMDEPLIVLSQEGFWHELHGFTSWRDIEVYTTYKIYKGSERIEEFVEFERCDGSHFKVYFIAPSIWDYTIGISMHKFIKLVQRFYDNS